MIGYYSLFERRVSYRDAVCVRNAADLEKLVEITRFKARRRPMRSRDMHTDTRLRRLMSEKKNTYPQSTLWCFWLR